LQRARVRRGDEELRLDWCYDSAFRFFPVQPDPEFGYAYIVPTWPATRSWALAGRSEVRDFLDILYLHEHYLSLGAMCWAACGKDQGFTPWSLLDLARRHVKYREEDLQSEHLTLPLRLTDLKEGLAPGRRPGGSLVRPAARGRDRLSLFATGTARR